MIFHEDGNTMQLKNKDVFIMIIKEKVQHPSSDLELSLEERVTSSSIDQQQESRPPWARVSEGLEGPLRGLRGELGGEHDKAFLPVSPSPKRTSQHHIRPCRPTRQMLRQQRKYLAGDNSRIDPWLCQQTRAKERTGEGCSCIKSNENSCHHHHDHHLQENKE